MNRENTENVKQRLQDMKTAKKAMLGKNSVMKKFHYTVFPPIYRRVSNKRRPLICAAPLVIHIEISASPLISAAPLNAALIRIVTIFY